jgi:hypothetical protein
MRSPKHNFAKNSILAGNGSNRTGENSVAVNPTKVPIIRSIVPKARALRKRLFVQEILLPLEIGRFL